MKVIATVQYGFTPPANLEQQANARLIAAAPDLLAFAKKIAGECAECGGDGQMFWYPDGVRSLKACTECVDVRAVIAKAEGQS
jgi:hypothetical protein